MNFPNDRFCFDEAIAGDAQEMLEILEESPFDGNISLLYTRRPDPIMSYKFESGECIFAVCRDKQENGRIAGFGICSVREMFINGKPQNVGYLEGLRVRTDYRRKFKIIPMGYDYIFGKGREKNIKYYYTTILKENIIAQKNLEKKRKFMPDYLFLDEYTVYIMKSRVRFKQNDKYLFRQAAEKDIDAIIGLVNSHGESTNFTAHMNKDLFHGKLPGLSTENFYVLSEAGKIIGCGAIFNQTAYKQYIVSGYSKFFRIIQKLSGLLNIFGLPKLPQIGGAVPLNTVAFFTMNDNNAEAGEYFLKNLLNQPPKNELVMIGFANGNKLNGILNKIKHIKYGSNVYLVDPSKENDEADRVLNGEINIDCGFL